MDNSDLLLLAAAQLDKWADGRETWTDNTSMAAQDRATAALLRAVADETDTDTESLGAPQWWRAHAAALALADTILGDTR